MLRVAVLADIHANLPALRAVVADVEEAAPDLVVVCGDVVGGPLPEATIAALMALGRPARFVQGNGDRATVEHFDRRSEPETGAPISQDRFSAGRINRAQRDFLAAFEPTVELEIDGLGPVCFCHGSPRSDTEIVTTATPDARLEEILADVSVPVIVGGHTHRQFDRRVGCRRFINAGSVGAPYEGHAAAYWALLGPDVELRRTEYDVPAALAEMRAGGWDGFDEGFRESLIEPMDPDAVAQFFEEQAQRSDGESR